LIAFEVFDQTTRLEQLAEAVEHKDRVQALHYVIRNLPDETSEWRRHKDELCALGDRSDRLEARRGLLVRTDPGRAFTEGTSPEVLEPLMEQLPRIPHVSQEARSHLASLLSESTTTAPRDAELQFSPTCPWTV
jgi:hypothetical protein